MYVCIHVVQSIHEHMAILIGMSKKHSGNKKHAHRHTLQPHLTYDQHLIIIVLRCEQIPAKVPSKAPRTHVTESLR